MASAYVASALAEMPVALMYHSVSLDTQNQKIYVLGGLAGTAADSDRCVNYSKDLHEYDLVLNVWNTLPIKLECRFLHTACCVSALTASASSLGPSCELYVYGGNVSSSQQFSDLQVGHVTNELLTVRMPSHRAASGSCEVKVLPEGPCRQGHTTVIFQGQLITFGGSCNQRHYYNDLWSYHLALKDWRLLSHQQTASTSSDVAAAVNVDPENLSMFSKNGNAGGAPMARAYHSCVMEEEENRMIVYGGGDSRTEFNDCWVLDLRFLVWRLVHLCSADPEVMIPRRGHIAELLRFKKRTRMFIFGGYSQLQRGELSPMVVNLKKSQCSRVSIEGMACAALSFVGSAAQNHQLYLLGGELLKSRKKREVWRISMEDKQKPEPPPPPPLPTSRALLSRLKSGETDAECSNRWVSTTALKTEVDSGSRSSVLPSVREDEEDEIEEAEVTPSYNNDSGFLDDANDTAVSSIVDGAPLDCWHSSGMKKCGIVGLGGKERTGTAGSQSVVKGQSPPSNSSAIRCAFCGFGEISELSQLHPKTLYQLMDEPSTSPYSRELGVIALLLSSAQPPYFQKQTKSIPPPLSLPLSDAINSSAAATSAWMVQQLLSRLGPLCGPYSTSSHSHSQSATGHARRPSALQFYAHDQCLLWTPEVFESPYGFEGYEAAYKRTRRLKCSFCGGEGASVGCFHESCKRNYHVACALVTSEDVCTVAEEEESFAVWCPKHTPKRAAPGTTTASQQKKRKEVGELGLEDIMKGVSSSGCQPSSSRLPLKQLRTSR